MSRKLIGGLLILLGVAGGFGTDILFFLVGGIEEVVRGISAHPLNGTDIAWGLIKALVFDGLGIFASFFLLILPGIGLMTSQPRLLRRGRRAVRGGARDIRRGR